MSKDDTCLDDLPSEVELSLDAKSYAAPQEHWTPRRYPIVEPLKEVGSFQDNVVKNMRGGKKDIIKIGSWLVIKLVSLFC